mmetsp:Transcript_9230/g.26616  ORF Transcript_9230/g.26616 Transcript_9230/m.26616 type:complete len:284 (+) Transcript_9230:2433-3284(+)
MCSSGHQTSGRGMWASSRATLCRPICGRRVRMCSWCWPARRPCAGRSSRCSPIWATHETPSTATCDLAHPRQTERVTWSDFWGFCVLPRDVGVVCSVRVVCVVDGRVGGWGTDCSLHLSVADGWSDFSSGMQTDRQTDRHTDGQRRDRAADTSLSYLPACLQRFSCLLLDHDPLSCFVSLPPSPPSVCVHVCLSLLPIALVFSLSCQHSVCVCVCVCLCFASPAAVAFGQDYRDFSSSAQPADGSLCIVKESDRQTDRQGETEVGRMIDFWRVSRAGGRGGSA